MGRKPTTGAKVLDLLTEIGPMSAREIADYLGVRIQDIHSAINVMRSNELKGEPRLIYVSDWEFPSRPNGGRENAVWAIGTKPDKKKPARDRSATQRRYGAKRNPVKRASRTAAENAGNHFALLIAQVTQ